MLMVLLGFSDYLEQFQCSLAKPRHQREVNIDDKYTDAIDDDNWYRFSALDNNLRNIDTDLEALLALYYSPGVAAVQPERARNMLGTPREADLKFGLLLFQEIQVLRFLGNTAAVSRHEAMLQWIIGRNNVTRAEVEAFYRNGIRALVSEIVNEEFNKISFVMGSPTRGYNAVLIRNPQNGHYILRYTDARGNTKEIPPAPSLDALSSAMSRNTAEFSRNGINTVRAQATLMPAVASVSARDEAVDLITAFYLNPNGDTWHAISTRFDRLFWRDGDRGQAAALSLYNALEELHPALARLLM